MKEGVLIKQGENLYSKIRKRVIEGLYGFGGDDFMEQLLVGNMSRNFAKEILNWKYKSPYDFYNNNLNTDSMREMLENQYYSVVDNNKKLVGFFVLVIQHKYLSVLSLERTLMI